MTYHVRHKSFRKNKFTCKFCGNEFTPKHHGTNIPQYCSHKCASNATSKKRKKDVSLKCKVCKSVFYKTPGEIRHRGIIQFCSYDCYIRSFKDVSKNSNYIRKKCAECGAEIYKLKSRANKTKKSFCNRECMIKYHKINPPRKSNGYWYENGYRVLYVGSGKGIKEHIKVMEDHIGRKLKPNETIHHRNRDRTDNRIENLVLATRSEHQMIHREKRMKGKIKIYAADRVFSRYIRLRDGRCVRCGNTGSGKDGIETLHCSHFFGRRKESVRYDPDNCDTLCFGCHQHWGSDNRESYREFKKKQLGEQRFNALVVRANTRQKRDRKLSKIKAQELLKTVEKK